MVQIMATKEMLEEYCKPYNIKIDLFEDNVIGYLEIKGRYTGSFVYQGDLEEMEDFEVKELAKKWARNFKKALWWGLLGEFPKIQDGDMLQLLKQYKTIKDLDDEYNRWKEEGLI